MNEPASQWQKMMPDLLALLDEEIELLGLRTRQFGDLYEVILHRLDEKMDSLLEEMTAAQQQQAELDEKLHSIRIMIARAMKRPMGEIRLSELVNLLDGESQRLLRDKRQQIILLAERLKRKHLTTALLLGQSARINRRLIESLLPRSETLTTYGLGGAKPWQTSPGLVDAEM
jgi:hypothetical protein